MNKSRVSTYEKISVPLRLPPEIYKKVREKVYLKKRRTARIQHK